MADERFEVEEKAGCGEFFREEEMAVNSDRREEEMEDKIFEVEKKVGCGKILREEEMEVNGDRSKYFRDPSAFTVVIVRNIDPTIALPLILQYLGEIPNPLETIMHFNRDMISLGAEEWDHVTSSPPLIGDCEVENDFDVGGDNSIQLLQEAAAANHAQAIVITLLEEYNNIFEEGSSSPDPDIYMDSEGEYEGEEAPDDDLSYDDYYDDEQDESIEGSDVDADDGLVSETNETGDSAVNDEYDDKDHILSYSSSKSLEVSDHLAFDQRLSTISREVSLPLSEDIKSCEDFASQNNSYYADESTKPFPIPNVIILLAPFNLNQTCKNYAASVQYIKALLQ
ncbi:hypothetical protein RYX36_012205 [Vicia faba]